MSKKKKVIGYFKIEKTEDGFNVNSTGLSLMELIGLLTIERDKLIVHGIKETE